MQEYFENLQKKRRDNQGISDLYDSLLEDKVFDTKMILSIENGPDCTDMADSVDVKGLNLLSEL